MWTDLDTRAISISVGIDVDVGMYFKNDDAGAHGNIRSGVVRAVLHEDVVTQAERQRTPVAVTPEPAIVRDIAYSMEVNGTLALLASALAIPMLE